MIDNPGKTEASVPQTWDLEADVVVVGFGAAGACAALEAAASGASVILIDRFSGGGATALSGGVVYAGGGTAQQVQAGVQDTPEAMFKYLATEVGDAVSAATLRDYCDGSAAMLSWLSGHGVPFDGSLCPDKTSYPTNRHFLYYSGSERSFAHVATPAPRGHRAVGRGTSGRVLFAALVAAVRSAGIIVVPQTRAGHLVTGMAGEVVGVECMSLRGAAAWVRLGHRMLQARQEAVPACGQHGRAHAPPGRSMERSACGRTQHRRATRRGHRGGRLRGRTARCSASMPLPTVAVCPLARLATTVAASNSVWQRRRHEVP
jgi:glycine/D-amino acid oxidase-like deaminating enzyme